MTASRWDPNRDLQQLRQSEEELLVRLKEMAASQNLNSEELKDIMKIRQDQEDLRFRRSMTELTEEDKRRFEEIRELIISASERLEKLKMTESEDKDSDFIENINLAESVNTSSDSQNICRNLAESVNTSSDAQNIYSELLLYADPKITVRIEDQMEKFGDIKAKPMSNLERGQFNGLDSTLKLTGTQIVSDIFHVEGNFQFSMPCMVQFQLKVEIDEKLTDLKAVIRENGYVKQIDAHYQAGYVSFPCKKTDLMYIVSMPKVTNVEITELNEYEYASDADETIRVHIPLGSVSEPTPVSFKVLSPNEDVAQKVQSARSTYAILAISKCLCVESKGKDLNLKKKATLQLPINIPDDTEDYELTLFVVKDDSVDEVKASIKKSEGKALSSEISTMKTMVYALMKKRTSVGPSIYNEILFHLGKVRYYKLLTFRDKKYPNVIWVECCPLESVQEVIQKRRTEGYILERHGGESNTLCFRQNQKIRAEVGGKIAKDSSIQPSKYLITILFDAEDKVAYFPFVRKAHGNSTNAVVKLVSDNFQKGKELWSLFFDPDRIGR